MEYNLCNTSGKNYRENKALGATRGSAMSPNTTPSTTAPPPDEKHETFPEANPLLYINLTWPNCTLTRKLLEEEANHESLA